MLTQMEIEGIVNECRDELKAIGINTPVVKVSTMRSTKMWGQCRSKRNYYSKKISSEIRLNKVLCDGDESHEFPLKNTIVHELLHAAAPFSKHGADWKYLADKVNRKYPKYKIKRCDDYTDYGLDITRKVERENLYIIKCEKCGQEVKRQRLCKTITHLNNYRCGKCGGDLRLAQTPEGIDVWSVHARPHSKTIKIHI